MIDFTNPNPNYWFKPEFARPKQIPHNAKTRYFIVNGKRKRVKCWRENYYDFVECNKSIWRSVNQFNLDTINEIQKEMISDKIKDLFESDNPFYSHIKK